MMSVFSHNTARRTFFQVLVIILILFSNAFVQAAQVTLVWDPNEPTPEGYMVFQRVEGEAYDYESPVWPQAGDNPELTTCAIDNLVDDTNYYFVVRAYAGDEQSGNSNEVTFRPEAPVTPTYTLSAGAGPNGSISPGSVTVNAGESQTFSISPDDHYHVADVMVDGVSVGPVTAYTFNEVNANHTVNAAFAVNTYTISASAGAYGNISPSGLSSVAYGSGLTYTITPDAGHHVTNVLVDGQSMGALQSYTFGNVAANHTIGAVFSINTYTITASAGTGGTIAPSGQIIVTGGSSQTFTLTANEGYQIEALVVDGVSMGALNSYTFANVNETHGVSAVFSLANQPPVADAGPDQVVDEAQIVTLSGLNSHDSDDGIATFQWRQIQGGPVSLNGGTSEEMVSFIAPDVDVNGEALVFELTVIDSYGAVSKDSCIVNVTWVNVAPTADAGADQTISEGTAVALSAAASTDPDDGISRYEWVQLQGPQVMLSDPLSSSPTFAAPDVGPEGASLIFQLTVTDGGGLQDTDTCKVTATWNNQEPLADAGPDQQVVPGDEVTLDGSQSMDADGSGLLYQWHQTDGSPVVLSDATAARPVFIVPEEGFDDALLVFELTVTDIGGLQGVDTCQVTVSGATQGLDTNPPTLTIMNPIWDSITIRSTKITIRGTAADDQQVDRVVWTDDLGNSGAADGTDQWVIKKLALHPLQNTVTVTAYDTVGNSQSKTIKIYVQARVKR